jgi:hypothetical protein
MYVIQFLWVSVGTRGGEERCSMEIIKILMIIVMMMMMMMMMLYVYLKFESASAWR